MVCQALWERDLDVVLTELDRMDEEEELTPTKTLNDDLLQGPEYVVDSNFCGNYPS